MPFNGNGTYNPPAPEYPAIAGEVILASDFNTIIADIAAALSLCVATDGQSGITANIDFGGNRILHIAPGIGPEDAVNMLQVFTNPTFTTTTAEGLKITGTGVTISVTSMNLTASTVIVATQAPGDATTKVANTAFVGDAVATSAASVTNAMTGLVVAEADIRAAADALLAPLLNAIMTGTAITNAVLAGVSTATEPVPATDSSQVATCHFVLQQAFQTVLPNQAGNIGKYLRTDGVNADWAFPMNMGDIFFSKQSYAPPVFLPCDASVFLKSSYTGLATLLGSLTPPVPYTINTSAIAPLAGFAYAAYGNGVWVMGASISSDPLAVTPDFASFSRPTFNTVGGGGSGLAFGAGLFVLAVYNGYYQTSPDGATWTQRTAETTGRGVAFGNGIFLMVRPTGVPRKSSDGLTWSACGTTAGLSTDSVETFFVNGYFYIIDFEGRIARTLDGAAFAAVKGVTASGVIGKSMAGDGGNILLATVNGVLLRSADKGLTWAAAAGLAFATPGFFVTYINGIFLLTGPVGGVSKIFWSFDGLSFTEGPGFASATGAVAGAITAGGLALLFQYTTKFATCDGYYYTPASEFITPYGLTTAAATAQGITAYIKSGIEV